MPGPVGAPGRLRALAGLEPDAPDLWERYDVRWHTHGSKTFHHPEVGDITPGYQSMQIEGPPGQRFIAYYAEPGTPEHDAMALLDLPAREPAGATASRDASTDAESSPSS